MVKVKLKRQPSEKDRKYRDKLKSDPVRYEAYLAKARQRYKADKEVGKIKLIADCNEREKRKNRRQWKVRQQNCRNAKKIAAASRPPTPPTSPNQPGQSGQHASGRKRVKRDRTAAYRKIAKLEGVVKRQFRNIKRLQKKVERNRKKETKSNKIRTKILGKYKLKRNVRINVASKVRSFLVRSDIARTMPGKKQCVTRHTVKKQIQVLEKSMKVTYQLYRAENPTDTISYASFCTLRPFWVLLPSIGKCDSCACRKHENLQFKANVLFRAKIISTNDLDTLTTYMCCSTKSKTCAYRKCGKCSKQKLPISDSSNYESVKKNTCEWDVWRTVDKIYPKNGVSVTTKALQKLTEAGTYEELMSAFQEELGKSLPHFFNITHQYTSLHELKAKLGPNEAIIHVDFSENWKCRGYKDIHGTHYGSSHQQATLHTGIVYVADGYWTFCTISESLRHDPPAIWAHMDPVLKELNSNGNIDTLHIVSDGPTAQYRNKSNFFLCTTLIYDYGFEYVSWNFMESGHGKGPADGVGGTIKRTAESIVSQGTDIFTPTRMFQELVKNDTTGKIKKFLIDKDDIDRVELLLDKKSIKPYNGTMKVHQVSSTVHIKGAGYFREISCFCKTNAKLICECYENNFFRLADVPMINHVPNNASTDLTSDATTNQTNDATTNQTSDATTNQTNDATTNQTSDATTNQTNDATTNQTNDATTNQTNDATTNQSSNATNNQTSNAKKNKTTNATNNKTSNATNKTSNSTNKKTTNATKKTTNATKKTTNATTSKTTNATINKTNNETTTNTISETTNATYEFETNDETMNGITDTTINNQETNDVPNTVNNNMVNVPYVILSNELIYDVINVQISDDVPICDVSMHDVTTDLPSDETGVLDDVTGLMLNSAQYLGASVTGLVNEVTGELSSNVTDQVDDATIGERSSIIMDSNTVGKWCMVQYDDTCYPGIINAIDTVDNEFQVNTMSPSDGDRYYWPKRKDMIWYQYEQFRGYIRKPHRVSYKYFKLHNAATTGDMSDVDMTDEVGDVLNGLVDYVVNGEVGDMCGDVGKVCGVVGDVLNCLVHDVVNGEVGDVVKTGEVGDDATTNQTTDATTNQTSDTTTNQTTDASTNQTSDATTNQTNDATTNQTSDATTNQTSDATTNQTSDATTNQTSDATTNQTNDATTNQTSDATTNQTSDATTNQTNDATTNQTSDATTNQTRKKESSDATTNQTNDATTNQTSDATTNQTSDATTNQSSDDVGDAMTGKVRDVVMTSEVGDVMTSEVGDVMTSEVGDIMAGLVNDVIGELSDNVTDEIHGQVEYVAIGGRSFIIDDNAIGKWCMVQYDDTCYPGIINAIDTVDNEFQVNTMSPSDGDRYYWPKRKDMIWYQYEQFRGYIQEPYIVCRKYFKLHT